MKFIKNKKGNFALIAIIVVPLILLLFSSIVCVNRRKNVERTEVKISLDSFCDYCNKEYGIILKNSDEDICYYTNPNKIDEMFKTYIKTIDGYVDNLWEYNLVIEEDELDSQSIKIICHTFFPKLSSSTKSIDFFGTYDGIDSKNGWYKDHPNTLSTMLEHKPEKDKNGKYSGNNYWTYERIEVITSCV